jgi:hypothetical protein
MSRRRQMLFLGAVLAWTTAVAALGYLDAPSGVWRYAAARAPGFISLIVVIWVVVPATLLLALVLLPVSGHLNRLFYGGHSIPADREKWQTLTLVVTSLFMAFGQAWQTAALLLLWHKRQLPWVAEAMRGPHSWGFPDPHQLIPRLWVAAGGVLIAWVGNGLPKLLTPFRGGREPYDWSRMMRTCGWAMTLGGLAAMTCSLLVADLRTALVAGGALVVTSALAPALIWAAYRFGGHTGVAPPESR